MSSSGPVDKKEKSRQKSKNYREKEKAKIQEMEENIAALEAQKKKYLEATTRLESDNAALKTHVLYLRQQLETAMYAAYPLPQTTTTATQTSEQTTSTNTSSNRSISKRS